MLRFDPSGDVQQKVRRFRPEIPIHPKASEIHGITDADVANEEPFKRRAKSLYGLLESCDLAGFNIRRFDLPILVAEFRRAGIEFELAGRRVIDALQIFHKEEPRTLEAAARKYLGHGHHDAHAALGDVRITASVLFAQLEHYPHLPRDLDELNAYCDEINPVSNSFSDWFLDQEESLVFRKRKHEGTLLKSVAAEDPSYLKWLLRGLELDDAARNAVKRALEVIN